LFYKSSAKIESFLGIEVNIGDFLLQISFFIVFFAGEVGAEAIGKRFFLRTIFPSGWRTPKPGVPTVKNGIRLKAIFPFPDGIMITVGTPGLGVRQPHGSNPGGILTRPIFHPDDFSIRTIFHPGGGRPDRASLQWMKTVDESVIPKLKLKT
jgi:hypothetical protein